MPAARRSRATRSGAFQRPSAAQAHSPPQRSTPWWQLHEVRSTIRVVRRSPRAGSAMASARLTTSKTRSVSPAPTREQALEEPVAERLVVPVQLAIRADDDQGWLVVRQGGRGEPGRDPLRCERVGIGRRPRLERDRRGQAAVVDGHRDVEPVAELDPVRPARLDARVADLPGREDRVPDAEFGQQRAASAGRPRPRAARRRSPAARTATRSRAGPRRSRSAGLPRRRAAGSCGGTAGRGR